MFKFQAGKKKFFIVILTLSCFFMPYSLVAQFEPGPQDTNTSAIHKNSADFSFWANDVTIQRGWKDIADTTLGKTSVGSNLSAMGKANNSVVSLGDKGEAVLTFLYPIYNVTGYDFAVFENGFSVNSNEDNEYFLELATVEISQDGVNFVAFESTSNTEFNIQTGSFSPTNCTKINNLAGKYPLNYGTPFDIDELGFDSIVAIKIIDVIGTIDTNFAILDNIDNIINDPYPTAFASGGFDLNAIGALNQVNIDTSQIDTTETSISSLSATSYKLYPNPIYRPNTFTIKSSLVKNEVLIYTMLGQRVFESNFNNEIKIETNQFEKGVYFVKINKQFIEKIMIQ